MTAPNPMFCMTSWPEWESRFVPRQGSSGPSSASLPPESKFADSHTSASTQKTQSIFQTLEPSACRLARLRPTK